MTVLSKTLLDQKCSGLWAYLAVLFSHSLSMSVFCRASPSGEPGGAESARRLGVPRHASLLLSTMLYFLGQIYHLKGCVQFGDHASFRYEFTRQSSELCVTEQDQSGSGEEPVPSVMVFTGIGLKEDVLKLWLQGCQHEVS